MGLIFLTITALLLLVNLAGVAILLHRWLACYPLAKVVGILVFCLLLFFIEHFVGLGKLTWLWPLTTSAAGYLIYRYREQYRHKLWRSELVFALGLIYGLIWRIAFPDIDGNSEALTDLSFVSNYFPGETLPPQDNWLPGYTFNYYYAFQQYAAALLGRILGLDIGYSYNLAFALLLAMMISLCWTITGLFCRSRVIKVLMVLAVVCGGTGVSPFAPFMYQSTAQDERAEAFESTSRLWASVRFIGKYDARVDTEFGKQLIGEQNENLELPLETIGYLTFQGDFHPPLGGFLLLMVSLLCILKMERQPSNHQDNRYLQATLVATGPLALLTNAWVLPLQSLLVLAWLGYRLIRQKPPHWIAVLLGGLIPLILSLPFLKEFTANALATPLGLVKTAEHTPMTLGLLVFWPQLLLFTLALFALRRQPILLFFSVVSLLLFTLSEFLVIDDPMGGKYNRFNTTLKWWSWLQVAVLLSLGPILLGANKLWIRATAFIAVLAVASYSLELANNWYNTSKPSFAKLQGFHWLAKDPVNKQIINYLKNADHGIVLEGIDRQAYTDTSAIALFANKASFTGWPSHQAQWRGNPDFIRSRGQDARLFYRGELTDSLTWLNTHQIQYIVWRKTDEQRKTKGWLKIQEQIARDYIWIPIQQHGNNRYGLWQKKNEESS